MQIHQLIVLPFEDSTDYSELRELVQLPNQVFATVDGAQAAAQTDLIEVIDAANMGETDPDFMTPYGEGLEWVSHDDGHLFALSEEMGLIYAIHTTELGA